MQRQVETEQIEEKVRLDEQPRLPSYPFKEYPLSENRPFLNEEIVDELFGMKSILDHLVQATRSKTVKKVMSITVSVGLTDGLIKKTKTHVWGNNPELAVTFQNTFLANRVLERFLERVAVSAERLLGGEWQVFPHYNPWECEFTLKRK